MKKISKLLIFLTCVAMVFAMSVGVSATDYNKEYSKTYEIGSGTTAAIDVMLTIESDESGLPFTAIPVHLNASSDPHMVLDALLESEVAAAGFSFYNVNTPLSSSSTYFDRIKYNNVYYTGSGQGYSGWQFRINGGIPQEAQDWGASIATAPIENGDLIAFYIDDPYSENDTTRYTRAHVNSASASAVTVQVTESHQWYGDNWAWTVNNFASIGGLTVGVYSDSSFSTSSFKGSAVADATTGIATISGLNLADGTYFVKVTGNMSGSPAISSCLTTFKIVDE